MKLLLTFVIETFTSGERGEGEEHPTYTKDTIKRAIREGIDSAGEPLDLTMPDEDV